jgi:hypothetical protein
MKGADQCPKCGSRKWGDADQAITAFYNRTLRVCGNCATAWEPFDEADLLDEGVQNSSFKEPCNNCAFRLGSNEQQDREKWRKLIATLSVGDSGWPMGEFYCHKGVPIDLHHEHPSDSGFAYPYKDGQPDRKKLRPCRGFLRMTAAQWDKNHIFAERFFRAAAEAAEFEMAGLGHA